MEQPEAVDLFCGLGGWAEGFLSEGFHVTGYDIEAHDYGTGGYPGTLILRDVRSIHGRDVAHARVIVASPPCTEYSYMAMPWKRAKQIRDALYVGNVDFPKGYRGSRTWEELNELFSACFRIQREASEAAGRHIPMIVENVKGAQPWVGRAKANFGSFYLWGDVGMVGSLVVAGPVKFGHALRAAKRQKVPGFNFHQFEKTGEPGGSFQTASVKGSGQNWTRFSKTGETSPHWRMEAQKNDGGSWFNVAHNKGSGVGKNPDGRKVPGIKLRDVGFNVAAAQRLRAERVEQTKVGGDWFGSYAEQKAAGTISPGRLYGKNSDSRKAASAQIAKIPFPLASYIARCFR